VIGISRLREVSIWCDIAGDVVASGAVPRQILPFKRIDGKASMAQAEPLPREAASTAGLPAADVAAPAAASAALQGLPLSLPPARTGLRRGEAVSLAAALALHGGILLAVVHATGPDLVGGGGSEIDAINIDVVAPSEVLEALAVDPALRSATAAARSDVASAPTEVQPAAGGQQKDERAEAAAVQDEAASQPIEGDDPAEPAKAARATAASEPATPTRGTSNAALNAPALAAAPPGIEREYARTVLFALARNKPKVSAGNRGTVRIGFTVSASGKVGAVRVAQTSGKAQLDEAALAAVRSTDFPVPPPQLGNGVLAYEIPYIFR
jgi:TonB family protein